MPVEFLSDEEAARFGRYDGSPSRAELERVFFLDDAAVLAQQLYDGGDRTVQQIADILSVPRSTVYGHLDKGSVGGRPRANKSPAGP